MTAQVLLSISILVGLHELGHLLAAKTFGMRVEKYSIGFPPKIFGFKYGETEYSVGAVPLGGFVKISGMIDESLDTQYQNKEPKDYEYRSKPAWQRLIVMLGGIFFNVFTGILIFIVMTYNEGENYIPKSELMEHGIVAYDLGQEIGLATGDRIIKLSGHEYDKLSDLLRPSEVFLEDNSYYVVERNGEKKKVFIPGNFIERLSEENGLARFFDIRRPFEVMNVFPGTGAAEAGLEPGDRIASINGNNIQYFDQLKSYLSNYDEETVDLTLKRGGELIEKEDVKLGENNTIGFTANFLLDVSKRDYSFIESIPKGTAMAFNIVGTQIKAFKKMFSGELNPVKSLAGPIGIAQSFGSNWNWSRFWRMTGLISMVLAFINLLPIPALDGGHVAFLGYEIVSGRKPSDSFLENAQKVGLVLLLFLMAFVIGNDIFKLIF